MSNAGRPVGRPPGTLVFRSLMQQIAVPQVFIPQGHSQTVGSPEGAVPYHPKGTAAITCGLRCGCVDEAWQRWITPCSSALCCRWQRLSW